MTTPGGVQSAGNRIKTELVYTALSVAETLVADHPEAGDAGNPHSPLGLLRRAQEKRAEELAVQQRESVHVYLQSQRADEGPHRGDAPGGVVYRFLVVRDGVPESGRWLSGWARPRLGDTLEGGDGCWSWGQGGIVLQGSCRSAYDAEQLAEKLIRDHPAPGVEWKGWIQ